MSIDMSTTGCSQLLSVICCQEQWDTVAPVAEQVWFYSFCAFFSNLPQLQEMSPFGCFNGFG